MYLGAAFVELGISDRVVPFRRPALLAEVVQTGDLYILSFSFLHCAQMTEFYLSTMRADENFANARNVGGDVHKIKFFLLILTEGRARPVCIIVHSPFLSCGSDLAMNSRAKAEKVPLYGPL